ncbi:hypothetical protein [Effusibacillus dendaii]|uniref:Uncharacterized protein n=1 Tax=Effusibacillus dendaii TaxID=2743772 RepID=A0A7I8DBL1_9BACL|nr:hypothetical protein [Effusibacillus dendaii]BCJ85311.1 hypothetical protein skT53_02960 [Effusibacillus dendaii]
MKYPSVDSRDANLIQLCREVARICISEEFQRLNREMIRLYRKSGITDPYLAAFQDALFSLFVETDADYHVKGSAEPFS